jgi:hypothetical protein
MDFPVALFDASVGLEKRDCLLLLLLLLLAAAASGRVAIPNVASFDDFRFFSIFATNSKFSQTLRR